MSFYSEYSWIALTVRFFQVFVLETPGYVGAVRDLEYSAADSLNVFVWLLAAARSWRGLSSYGVHEGRVGLAGLGLAAPEDLVDDEVERQDDEAADDADVDLLHRHFDGADRKGTGLCS